MFNSDNVLVPEVMEAGFDPFRARVAVGGFLAGYSAKTLEAYALDLQQWSQWCLNHDIDLFEVRRAHIELFARWLEETGRARSTILDVCRQSPGSTGTAPKNNSSTIRPLRMYAAPKCPTSRTRRVWTATSSACF